MSRLLSVLLAAVLLSAPGCIFHRVQVRQVSPNDAVAVKSPVKAHLKDGSTVLYTNGVSVYGGTLRGSGVRYDLALKQGVTVDNIPLDSVIGMESYQTRVEGTPTVIVTALASVGAFAGTVALFKAIFGSCPTVYSNGGADDEGELFSNSIAPALEARDLDRLRARPEAQGNLRLELRNEALETHYINHLQLLEVQHAASEFVLPDARGHALVVSGVRPPPAISDRAGRDLQSVLGAAGDSFYSTNPRSIEAASTEDMDDWIDLIAPVPDGANSATLVFRLRNSLLSTTLLYDVILAPAGARSIDWLSSGVARMSTLVELGRWYQRRAGLHISVWRDGAYREAARVPDSGPIAWHDVAAVIPALPGESSLRIRLSFLSDHWRIDRVGVASASRQPAPRIIPISEVTGPGGRTEIDARASLEGADSRYLQTSPGQRFYADFHVGGQTPGQERTFLLSSQGYYTEWIRGSWIQTASTNQAFTPTDQAVLAALRQWSAKRDTFEARFMRDRVPVH